MPYYLWDSTLEETAKLFLMLRGAKARLLTPEQVRALEERFPPTT